MIRVAIGGKSKALLLHLTSDPPEQSSETYEQWEQEDLIVFSLLIQNIEPTLAGNLTKYHTAKTLWDALVIMYNSRRDKLQTFNLHVKANDITQNKTHLKCGNCGMTRHTTEQCFELIGYPGWWNDGHKKGNKNQGQKRGKASAANTDTDRKNSTGFEGMAATTINEEDGSFSMSTTQNYNINQKQSWIIDCGATDTMTYDLSDFATSTKPTKSYIHTANGKNKSLSHKLLSISHVTKELNCLVIMQPTFCILHDIRTGAIIRRGTKRQGLYYVDEVTRSGTVMRSHGTAKREAWLWHRRLGHPSTGYLRVLFPKLFPFNCMIHQTTCPHTPEQNGVAKRKNRILLEITRALLVESQVPKFFWPEALATVHIGQGERECIDTLSWLKYVTYEEGRNHSTQPEDPNVSVAQEAPILIPEVSNTHSFPISEPVETTNNTSGQDTSERYALPPRGNLGVLPKRYSPKKMSRGSRYPIANIAKGNISEESKAFALSMYSDEIPANTKQALKSKHWKDAMKEELKALIENNTWEKRVLPPGKKTVGCQWVFIIKYKPDEALYEKKARLVEKGRYQRMVGRLIYLSHTRPDIAHAVGVVSQFMRQPQKVHMKAVLRIIRYLKGTAGHGVLFKQNGHLETQLYTDADWVGDKGDQRSTSGYFTVGGNLVTWRSKKQKVVALLSAEAEFRGIARGITKVLWIRKLLTEIGYPPQEPSKVMSDNKAAI
uniref:Putative ribonuclease H-like domain-containing protein n=1 Tax=Tanacetum cinerariifolium TaxID=118510 RepID=A0A699IAH1_TANCI|nr:putative ribonuclease H-like domain-containing protein [Tanacetum cinerariifolium]